MCTSERALLILDYSVDNGGRAHSLIASIHHHNFTTLAVYYLAMGDDAGRRDGKKRGRSRGGGDGVALPRLVFTEEVANNFHFYHI